MRALVHATFRQIAVLALISTSSFQSMAAQGNAPLMVLQSPVQGGRAQHIAPDPAARFPRVDIIHQRALAPPTQRQIEAQPQQAAASLSIEDEARVAFEAKRDRLKPDRLRFLQAQPRSVQTTDRQPQQIDAFYFTYAEGVVTAGESGLPVSNVFVAAYDSQGIREDYAFTDRLGRYRMILSPGTFFVHFDPAQVYPYYFAPEWYDNQAVTNTATLITATETGDGLPRPVITANAVLDRGAQVTGSVLALDTGLPVTRTRIVIFDVNGIVVNALDVNADGQYFTSGLMTGVYQICAFVDVSFGEHTRYVNGCDTDAPLQSSVIVTVTVPNILPNIKLSLVPGAQVSGVVRSADTNIGLQDVAVVLQNRHTRGVYFTRTITDGQYLVDGMPNGLYQLYYSTRLSKAPANAYVGEYYDGKLTSTTADVLTLTAPLSTVINTTLDRGVTLQGKIVAPNGGMDIVRGRVAVIPASAADESDLDPTRPVWYITDDHGVYTVTVRPGQYKIKSDSYRISSTLAYCGKYLDGSLTFGAASTVTVSLTQTQVPAIVLQAAAIVSGYVYVENTTTGVNAAQIELQSVAAPEFGDIERTEARSDVTGAYVIRGICNTHYKMLVVPPRPYAWRYYPNTLDIEQSTEIPIARESVTQINPQVSYLGLITGQVVDAKIGLAPLGGVIVAAMGQVSPHERTIIDRTYTDFRGRYELWLPPGAYQIAFSRAVGYDPDGLGQTYCTEWNYGARTMDLAPSILLRPQEFISNINAALTSATIRGKLSAVETGQPLPAVDVNADPVPFEAYWSNAHGQTDSQGVFQVNGVCRGRHVLHYQPRSSISPTNQYPLTYSGNSTTAEEATIIDIRNSDVVTFNDSLQLGVPLSVSVVATQSATDLDLQTILVLDEAGHLVYQDVKFSALSPFAMVLPKDRYKVRVWGSGWGSGSGNSYAYSFYNGKAGFAEADVVDLTVTNPISNINIALSKGYTITGRVLDADTNRGVASVLVLAYDVHLPGHIYEFASTDANGYFTTSARLAPGAYTLQFERDTYRTVYLGGSTDFEKAAAVTITAGTTAMVDMRLPRLDSQVNLVRRIYMPIIPAAQSPIVSVIPTATPVPPTATPGPAPTVTARPPLSGTVVFSGTFPSGTVGRSILLSNFIQISDVKVKGDPSFKEGDEYIDLLNSNTTQTVSMSLWRIRVNGVAEHYIPGNASTSQNFALAPGQGCRIYTGSVNTQQVPAPYNYCGTQSFFVTSSSIGLYTNDHGTIDILDENSKVVASFIY